MTALTATTFSLAAANAKQSPWTETESRIYGVIGASYLTPIILNSSADFPILFITMKSFRVNLKKTFQSESFGSS